MSPCFEVSMSVETNTSDTFVKRNTMMEALVELIRGLEVQ